MSIEESKKEGSRPIVEAEIRVDKKKLKLNKVLLDTGNEYGTILSIRVAKENKLKYKKLNALATVANGSTLTIYGELEMEMIIADKTISVHA